ncbi:MAG: purine-nucleoside phosphorylase [Sulfurospirillaceae bacterium]|nr:purine-nucleoside phosphorylase [Sulfurospirillaceae bacterium]
MILCAGKSESFDFARPIGIGLIEAAMTLTQLVVEEKPSFLFFVGTAGSYGNLSLFDTVKTSKASNIELGFLDNLCYSPIEAFVETSFPHVSRGTTHPNLIVNSSNYITTGVDHARKMLSLGIDLENMEFYAILCVAQRFNLPASGFFVITNFCDANAHHDFISNHNHAKDIIAQHVEKNLKI